MKRQLVVVAKTDSETEFFDPDRAREEGLFEEMTLEMHIPPNIGQNVEFSNDIPEEFLDWLMEQFELADGIPPGTRRFLTFTLMYRYDYGKVEA